MKVDLPPEHQTAEELIRQARREGITIFGAGSFALAVRRAAAHLGLDVKAFVVSSSRQQDLDGIPVLSLGGLSEQIKALPMWIGVFNHRQEADYSLLRRICSEAGVINTLLPQCYFEAVAKTMGWRYWLTDRVNYADCEGRLANAFAMLDSEKSKQQFEATLSFRLGHNLDAAPQPDADPQYFPAVVAEHAQTMQGIWLADGGAYDGDSLREAAMRVDLKGAYAFEPDPENFRKLGSYASGLSIPVICFPCGVSGATELLSFSTGQGEACAIGAEGDTRIQGVALDDCLHNQPVNFIKLDIEGSELEALRGASRIIRRNRPILAIAAYHHWDHIWSIPEFVRSLAMDYRLAYRTHEHNTFDSVFYAY